ncbi:MAG: zinc ribbon domain-containing protein [Lachnospiraceae bacterium]|nr:zinc ribbon domain-containing protein [Lachnospiraceae bacterium]
MKTCPFCSSQQLDDAAFCMNCGRPLNQTAPAESGAGDAVPSAPAGDNAPAAPAPEKAPEASAPGAGAPLPPPVPQQAPAQGGAAAPKKSGSGAKLGAMIGIAAGGVVAAVIVIIILINVLGGGYKKPMNDIIKSLNGHKMDSKYFSSYLEPNAVKFGNSVEGCFKKSDYYEDWKDDMADSYDDMYDSLEDTYGEHVRFSVKWKDKKKMSDRDIRDMNEDLEDMAEYYEKFEWDDDDAYEDFQDYMGDLKDGADLKDSDLDKIQKAAGEYVKSFDKLKVTAGVYADLEITIKGRKKDSTLKLRNAEFVKLNGKWYFVDSGEKDYFNYGRYSCFGERVWGELSQFLY